MSYSEALEAAGAYIVDEGTWGDYQGTWISLVYYGNTLGYVSGWYGSCSGCDAFEAEFEWRERDRDDYQERLANFGKGYLGNEDGSDLYTYEEILRENTGSNWDWDMEAKEKAEWIRSTEKYFHMLSLPFLSDK
jgi:hypothetical protein